MEVSEQLYRIKSPHWGDYQKLIDFLKQTASSRLHKIGMTAWRLEIELANRYRTEDGWLYESTTPMFDKEKKFFIQLTLKKQDGFDIDPAFYRDDGAGMGFGGVPSQYRIPKYKRETIDIDDAFIKEHKL